VVLFFTISTGKRGLYVLPAVPALAMAPRRGCPSCCGHAGHAGSHSAWPPRWWDSRRWRRVFRGGWQGRRAHRARLRNQPVLPLAVAALLGAIPLALLRVARRLARLRGRARRRDGDDRVRRLPAHRRGALLAGADGAPGAGGRAVPELGLMSAKEQYLLEVAPPSVNFGHARWRRARGRGGGRGRLAGRAAGRALMMDKRAREACFAAAQSIDLGKANRSTGSSYGGSRTTPACSVGIAARPACTCRRMLL